MSLVNWYLYLLQNTNGVHYSGISTDVERRLQQHNGERPGGAKATRRGRPWILLRTWGPWDRSTASRFEYLIKKIKGKDRISWNPNSPKPLSSDSSP